MSGSYKRIYAGIGAAITILAVFAIMQTSGVKFIHDGNKACAGTLDRPCVSYFKVVNPTSTSFYIYNKNQTKLEFSKGIKDYRLYVKYYGKWVETDFTNYTRLPNVPKDAVYNFVFPRYSTKEFKLVGYKDNPSDVVKWGFGFDENYLDPIWSSDISSNITILDSTYSQVANVSMTWLNSSSTCLLYNTTSGIYGQWWFEHDFYADHTLDEFNTTDASVNVTFADGGGTDYSVGVELPKNATVTSAEVDLTGYVYDLYSSMDYTYDTKDASAIESDANTNYGVNKMLFIMNNTGDRRVFYIAFDLSTLSGIYTSAKLQLYKSYKSTGQPANTISVYRVTEDWVESTLTWNNKPAYDGTILSGSAVDPTSLGLFNITLDTDNFNSLLNGTYTNYGWTFWLTSASGEATYSCHCSRDASQSYTICVNTLSNRPTLFLTKSVYPTNITIDTGGDGNDDYTNTTSFETTETVDLNSTAIQDYLDSCTADGDGNCNVPFKITSDSAGILELSALSISYQMSSEYSNTTATNFTNNETEAVSWITSVPLDYGNYTVRAWANDSCSSLNVSSDLTIYARNLTPTFSMPTNVTWVKFSSNCTYNSTNSYVDADNQTSTVGIFLFNNSQTQASDNLLIYLKIDYIPNNIWIFADDNSSYPSPVNLSTSYQQVATVNASSTKYIFLNANCTGATTSNYTIPNVTISYAYGVTGGET